MLKACARGRAAVCLWPADARYTYYSSNCTYRIRYMYVLSRVQSQSAYGCTYDYMYMYMYAAYMLHVHVRSTGTGGEIPQVCAYVECVIVC